MSSTSLTRLITDELDRAWNRHDEEAILRYYADDAVFTLDPPLPGAPPVSRGTAEIAALVRALLPGFHVESRNLAEQGDRVTWRATVSNDLFRSMGVEAAECDCEARVRDGIIYSFTPRFTAETIARMQAAQNKQIVRRYQELHNANTLDALDEIVSPDLVSHSLLPGLPQGLESGKQVHRMAATAMPDLGVDIEDLIAEGDRVVMRFTTRGTHTGAEFIGAPPSGRRIAVSGISIFRLAGGKIVEHWAEMDTLGLLQQLGVIPVPEPAGL